MFQSKPNRYISSRSKKVCTGRAKMLRFPGKDVTKNRIFGFNNNKQTNKKKRMKSEVNRLKPKERKKEKNINQVLTPAFTPWQDEFYEEILKPKSASSILPALSCRFCRLQLSTSSKLVISKKMEIRDRFTCTYH